MMQGTKNPRSGALERKKSLCPLSISPLHSNHLFLAGTLKPFRVHSQRRWVEFTTKKMNLKLYL